MSTNAKPYKETLNLPATEFAMKANLPAREPKIQAEWREQDLYGQLRRARKGAPVRVLHDGPPYANGDIHMGTALNKMLKDFVVRSLSMRGFDSPYVPGWDTHGLPIEHKVMKDLGPRAAGLSRAEIRELCRVEAMKWVDVQRDQFRRLGVMGDWDDPYLTLDHRYEAGITDVLADLLEGGYVFRQLKPIHWCTSDQTALAEAELEYRDETSTSVHVLFPMIAGVPDSWLRIDESMPEDWRAMIWTTTPWTLPANAAVAVHPDLEYVGVRYDDPETGATVRAILGAELVKKVMDLRGIADYAEVGRCKGRALEHAQYRHPFVDRVSPIVLANYVSVEDGTGLVHTAPGHGGEDYLTGRAYQLPVLSPVDPAGKFTAEAPDWLVGLHVLAANPRVVDRLREIGALYLSAPLTHSYPHCWRCKKPVIFRATEQWFVGVDRNDLRGRTLAEIRDAVTWYPAWGRSRIEAMVTLRPDWCVSRQRSWGVPIPALGCVACDAQLLTAETARHFRDLFRKEGADAWFARPVEEILPPDAKCPNCGGTEFRKEGDILDVWFESGSSHRAVLAEGGGFGLGFPAHMYLEGSDQHRGWFQSSILTAVGTTGRAPFESILTHGFVVDDKGQKMSKSLGNVVSAVKATEQHGADVLRLMIAGMDYADDVRVSERSIKEASESYRKIRNTFRYLLGNLEDYRRFDPSTIDRDTLLDIDLWALGQLNQTIREALEAYERYEFYWVVKKLNVFMSITLSSFYLDVLKDRLYAEEPTGDERRAAQFVLFKLHEALTRLLAPILPHTAEESWGYLPHGQGFPASVHLATFPDPDPRWDDPERDARWAVLKEARDAILKALEGLRRDKTIGSAQEAAVEVVAAPADASILQADRDLLAMICLVSQVTIKEGGPVAEGAERFQATAAKSTFAKCERCWNHRVDVGRIENHPTLCGRCVRVIEAAAAKGPA